VSYRLKSAERYTGGGQGDGRTRKHKGDALLRFDHRQNRLHQVGTIDDAWREAGLFTYADDGVSNISRAPSRKYSTNGSSAKSLKRIVQQRIQLAGWMISLKDTATPGY
jgi:hypothetical protein